MAKRHLIVADVASALVESRKRGRLQADLAGGIAFSAAELLTAAAAGDLDREG
jgi:hypothetical protein